MPAVAFTREYLCKPIASDSSLFPSEMTDPCKNDDHKLEFQPEIDEDVNYYIGWDPAISPDRKADYTCMVVLAMDENRHKRIVWMHHEKGMDFSSQIDKCWSTF